MKGKTHKESAEIKKQMQQYKAEGHTNKEVAEKFNYSIGYCKRICKGINIQKPTGNQWTRLDYSIREAKAIETINKHLSGKFEYAGGFTNCDASVQLRCLTCGEIVTRSLIGIRVGNGVKCPKCKEAEQEQKRKEKLEKKRQQYAEELKRKSDKLSACEQIEMQVCKCCGAIFFGNKKKYCSQKCARKVGNSNGETKRRIRIKEQMVDKDISLEGLFKRDNGVCALCGGQCDWNDYKYKNNYFIAGNDYPSIDHIFPLSKGGLHSWDNIQLAHRKCNTMKGNDISLVV